MLFVCTGNSARSQLAAALWTARTGQPSSSAGTHPARCVHPGAVAAARRAGLDLGSAVPRSLLDADRDAQMVTVCDRAHEELVPPPTAWHWSIADPVAAGTDAAFDATVRALDDHIARLQPTTAQPTAAEPTAAEPTSAEPTPARKPKP
jgi:protein-tyrosine-phosphatase